MHKFWLQAVIIIAAGLITGFAFSLTSPVQLRIDPNTINQGLNAKPPKPVDPGTNGAAGQPAPTGQPSSTGSAVPTPPAPENDLFISIEAAKAIFDSQQAIFIDARPRDDYFKSHIPNAMHLEKDSLNGPPPDKVLNYLPGMQVVVYCHGELCTDSENVIKRLAALKKDIGPFRIIKAGFPGWEKAGYPTAAGAEVGFE